jgi:phosphomannomutase
MAASTSVDIFPAGIKPFAERKFPKTLCMFDVDGTLSLARRPGTPEMLALLKKLRSYTAIAFVGGSNLPKIEEQLLIPGEVGACFLQHLCRLQ